MVSGPAPAASQSVPSTVHGTRMGTGPTTSRRLISVLAVVVVLTSVAGCSVKEAGSGDVAAQPPGSTSIPATSSPPSQPPTTAPAPTTAPEDLPAMPAEGAAADLLAAL